MPRESTSFEAYTKMAVPKPTHARRAKAPAKKATSDRKASIREYFDANAGCEVQIALMDKHGEIMLVNDCPSTSDEVHHICPKASGGSSDPSIHSEANLMSICRYHHRLVTENRSLQ